MMRKLLVLALVLTFSTVAFCADDNAPKAVRRVEAAGTVLDEIQGAPDQGIPEEVLGSAECVAVVPSLLKAGFVVGGRFGRGVASCRTPKGWSAPAFFTVGGGSFGLQIGRASCREKSVDLGGRRIIKKKKKKKYKINKRKKKKIQIKIKIKYIIII